MVCGPRRESLLPPSAPLSACISSPLRRTSRLPWTSPFANAALPSLLGLPTPPNAQPSPLSGLLDRRPEGRRNELVCMPRCDCNQGCCRSS